MPAVPSAAVLCGGFGAARFVSALAAVVPDLCCIVNTADDLDHLGLHVSPDVDSVCYGVAGRFDEARGWGLVDDTFRAADTLARHRCRSADFSAGGVGTTGRPRSPMPAPERPPPSWRP